jgi:hypothetical protein
MSVITIRDRRYVVAESVDEVLSRIGGAKHSVGMILLTRTRYDTVTDKTTKTEAWFLAAAIEIVQR